MSTISRALSDRILRSTLPPAVVVGTDVTGTSLARALASGGVPVIGVDDRIRRYSGSARAYAHIHLVPQGFRERAIIGELEALARDLPRRAVLFLSMDNHVTIIGAHGQHLRDLFTFEFSSSASVELLMDKQRFADYAVQQGWPVPKTFICDNPAEIEPVIEHASFPVILKPRVKTPKFAAHSPSKVYRCDSPQALRDAYRTVSQWEPGVIVQEWIPGGDDEVYFSFHYLAEDGRQVAAFEGRKLRQFPPGCGNTTAAVPVAELLLEGLSLEILRTSGAAGFCAVEYKRDPRNGTYYIMEPTIGRVNLQIGTAIANGANLPWAAYCHLVGLPPVDEKRPARPRTWVYFKNDIKSARYHISQGSLSWFRYFASVSGPKCYAVWQRGEYRMALAVLSHQLRRVPSYIGRRIPRLWQRLPPLPSALRQLFLF